MSKIDKVTVVIPTIGEESLIQVIESLVNGSVIPDRILICIPFKFKYKVQHIEDLYGVVEILTTNNGGQVHQRLAGFLESKSKYTLQLDSDIIVDKELLSELINRMKRGTNIAVGPVIYDYHSNQICSYLSPSTMGFSDYELKLLYWVSNGRDGFEPGRFAKSGINFGLDDYTSDHEVEWLPGGCVLHKTKNLVLENFYPYKGKAYAEDLYHSKILTQKGIKLFVANSAIVKIKFIKLKSSDIQYFIREQYLYMRAMLNLIKINKNNKLRYILFRFLILIFKFKKKLFTS